MAKVSHLLLGRLSRSEGKENSSPFLAIILGLLASLICGYILFIITTTHIFRYNSAALLIGSNCFIGIFIGLVISYGLNKNKYSNKKVLFILILLCLLLAYSVCILALYLYHESGFSGSGFIHFLMCSVEYRPLSVDELSADSFNPLSRDQLGYKYTCYIIRINDIITSEKLYVETLFKISNIETWIIELIIANYSAWLSIIFTCSWLLPQNIFSKYSLFFKKEIFKKEKRQRNFFFLLIFLIFIAIINYGIQQYITISNSRVNRGVPAEFASGNLAKVKELLTKEPELINAKNDDNWTPLHFAVKSGSKEVVEFLISRGADVNDKETSYNRYTPLHTAAEIGSKEIVEILVDNGANINAKGFEAGITPLHIAARHDKNKKIVEFLISRGADVNAKSFIYGSYTPLYCAIWGGAKEIVEVLVSRGADINIKDRNGYTPLSTVKNKIHGASITEMKNYKNIEDILIKHGAKD